MPPSEIDSGSKAPTGTVEETQSAYGAQRTKQTATKGGLAALTRAAEKAIARARAAGLEPVIRYEDTDKKPKDAPSEN
jgi:hypothetical protein